MDLKKRTYAHRKNSLTQDERDMVAVLSLGRWSHAAIARLCGVSRHTVARIAREIVRELQS